MKVGGNEVLRSPGEAGKQIEVTGKGTYFFRAARNLSNSFRLIEIEKTCSELGFVAI